jgi:hypothetical protein
MYFYPITNADNTDSVKVKKGKKKKDQYVYEILPDPAIGYVTEEDNGTIALAPGVENLPVAIVNHRKAVGWKAELLAEYANGERAFNRIVWLYQNLPDKTQQYLTQHNLIRSIGNDRWRKIGFKADPRSKASGNYHDYDEWCDKPETKALIREKLGEYRINKLDKKK